MVLIFANYSDFEAEYLNKLLTKRGAESRIFFVEEYLISYDLHLKLTQKEKSETMLNVLSKNGDVTEQIGNEDIEICINRVKYFNLPFWKTRPERDYYYVYNEVNALWAAWMKSLDCKVMNTPSNGSFVNNYDLQEFWLTLAAESGWNFKTLNKSESNIGHYFQSHSLHDDCYPVLKVGSTVIGTHNESIINPLIRINTEGLETIMLWFRKSNNNGDLKFECATRFPNFSQFDPCIIYNVFTSTIGVYP